MNIKKILILLIIFITNHCIIFANQKTHVYTKIIEKTFDYTRNSELIINAEKAKININRSLQSTIQIKISLVSKNEDQNLAKNDLKYLEANINKSLNKIFVNNYILVPGSVEKISSNLQAIYEISVPPEYLKINIENKLGNIKMNELKGNFILKVEYTDVEIKQLSGQMKLYSSFGDIICDQCDMVGYFNTSYSKINMIHLKGKNEIITRLGTLTIQPEGRIENLLINSRYTSINVINKECNTYNYNISTNLGNIYINENCIFKDNKNIKLDTRQSESTSKQLIYENEKNLGTMTIQSVYEDVHIQ